MNCIPQLLSLDPYQRVLVLVPHPDDEALGCGGLLALLAKAAAQIQVVLVTDGAGAPHGDPNLANARRSEFLSSLEVLGITCVPEFWCIPDGSVESSVDLNANIQRAVDIYRPQLIICPWDRDLHPDHATIGRSIRQLAKRMSVDVLYFEVWAPLNPTHLVDITSVIQIKRRAIDCHSSALRFGNFREALIGLNAYRSLYLPYYHGTPNFAEAFELLAAKRVVLNLGWGRYARLLGVKPESKSLK